MTDSLKSTAAPPNHNALLPEDIWPTRCAVAMADTIDTCRKSGQIGLVAGPSGIGKTTAARAVAEALDDDGAIAHYVMMTRAADGLQPGLLRIARAIGASAQPNAASADIYDAVVWCIANWPRGSVLVLDEAQFMSEALIDALRNISDDLRGRRLRRGIVMVGTADLAARIDGRAGGRTKHYEPLRGRLYLAELHALADDDFVAVTQALGIAGPGAVAAIAKAGAGRGGLHNVARVVEAARRVAGAGHPLSLAHIRVATQGIGVAP
jgi:type II secretory pathway predicted ATPase ExeA